MKEDFLKRRDAWLNEVSDKCHEYALRIDRDFYVFQTPVDTYQPDLLIIGINPGGDKKYSQTLEEKGYKKRPFDDLAYSTNILVEKPQWEIDAKLKGANTMRSRFRMVFNKENDLDHILENTVMMNMFYFNTKTAEEIKDIVGEIRSYCRMKTLEFIEIINPKNILILGSTQVLKEMGVIDFENIAKFVKQGKLGERVTLSIPHYSAYSYYSKENSQEIARGLKEALNV